MITLDKLRVTHGENFVRALENIIARQWSGRNRQVSPDASTNKLLDWINNASGTIMFWNARSAALQLLSVPNFLFEKGKISKHYFSDIVKVWNSDYLRARRGESGFDLSAAEIASAAGESKGFNKLVSKLIQFGFTPTRAIDALAVALGGAAVYRSAIDSGASEQEALRRLQEVSEENQQSARPDKISEIQAGPLGRIIFAFGNTPFQYARLTKRTAQDIFSGRSSDRGTLARDLGKMSWYGAVQSVIFTMLQQAVDGLVPDEDDDNDEKKRKAYALDGFITSYIKAFGGPGAITAASYPILKEISGQMKNPEFGKEGSFLLSAVSASPAISSRLRKLLKFRNEAKSGSLNDPKTEDFWKTIGYGLNVSVNVPLDRAVEKFHNLKAIVEEDYSFMTDLALALGWKEWQLDAEPEVKEFKPFEEGGSFDPFSGDE